MSNIKRHPTPHTNCDIEFYCEFDLIMPVWRITDLKKIFFFHLFQFKSPSRAQVRKPDKQKDQDQQPWIHVYRRQYLDYLNLKSTLSRIKAIQFLARDAIWDNQVESPVKTKHFCQFCLKITKCGQTVRLKQNKIEIKHS